jgi:hypothetical protein
MKKEELRELAQQMRTRCYYALENAPQAMSNVCPILDVLTKVNKLIEHLEREE